MKKIPDWIIQTVWFIAGISATGAVWYFLGIKEYFWAIIAIACAIIFYGLAIYFLRSNDKIIIQNNIAEDDIVIQVKEEKITFNEFVRSVAYDIVKVNAHTHSLGVVAEYQWMDKRYPNYKLLSQSLSTFEALQNKHSKTNKNKIHFDIMDIILSDGRNKKIYFDISSFFTGNGSMLDPTSIVVEKLRSIYK